MNDELNRFYIEFALVPTAHNRNILISVHELRGTLVRTSSRVELSPEFMSKTGLGEHVVFKVSRIVNDVREIYYEHRGYGAPHISPRLDTMIDQEIKDKYV